MQRPTMRAMVLALLILFVLVLLLFAIRGCNRRGRSGAAPTTWYVRPDGGTRYSDFNKNGQCDGLADAAYTGTGVNQHCAWKDVRALWADGSYTTTASGYPKYGWVGQSGDIYLIDCPTDCRIGYDGPNSNNYSPGGIAGNPYSSGAPVPPNGTPDLHTKILGKNWQNCTSDAAKARINGGYGVSGIFNFKGVSYVDFACFDISDHSSCGKAGQTKKCNTGYPLDDYADNAIVFSNTTTNVTITDVRAHGLTNTGFIGPTGDQVTVARVALVGNASSGWNMDAGNSTTGTGLITLDHFQVLWNGCAEEYPIVDPLPYQDCTDQNSSGYGDGLGTATLASVPPWRMVVTNSIAAYNTQDGFDLLHLSGGGSTLVITGSDMYGNMGQQLKVGSQSISRNNLIVGNCNALRQAIPGTPAGYNSRLSNFCRAGDAAVALAVSDSTLTSYQFNDMKCANATCVQITCGAAACTNASTLVYQNNLFYGYKNSTDTGYPASPPPTNDYSNPIYLDAKVSGLFSNAGSSFDHNATWHWKSNWSCPKSSWSESSAVCVDPQIKDASWPMYGTNDMTPLPTSPLIGAGVAVPAMVGDYNGNPRSDPPTIGALEVAKITGGYKMTVNVIGPGDLGNCQGSAHAAGSQYTCPVNTQTSVVSISGCNGTVNGAAYTGTMSASDCQITAQFLWSNPAAAIKRRVR